MYGVAKFLCFGRNYRISAFYVTVTHTLVATYLHLPPNEDLNATESLYFLLQKIYIPQPSFTGVVAKLRKATFFVMTVCPSIRVEQLGSHRTDFDKTWYLSFFENLLRKFEFN